MTHIHCGVNSAFNENLSIKNNKYNNLNNINKCLNNKNYNPLYHTGKSDIDCKTNKEKKRDLNKCKGYISYLFRRNETYLYHSKFNKNYSLKKTNESENSSKKMLKLEVH